MKRRASDKRLLRLQIEPIVRRAEKDAAAVERDLPDHQGLLSAAKGVASAAHEAERVSRALRRKLSFHRLPAGFLALAVLLFAGWCYWYFFHISRLTIALPERDAIELHDRVSNRPRVMFNEVSVPGSREAAEKVASGEVDLAFIQGGIPIPAELQRLETPRPELVLFFLRDGVPGPASIRRILTSLEGEGSHSVAQDFAAAWGLKENIDYLHDWTKLGSELAYTVPPDVDAVFVVKDPSSEQALFAAQRLADTGFHLASPDLGARALNLDYLRSTEIPVGYLRTDPPVPLAPVATYNVATYLVARQGLTPRLLGMSAHLLDSNTQLISEAGFEPDVSSTSELLQGMEAFIGILLYIGLAFLALLGIEMMTYRRRFNELDSLISLISMHQSSKDVLGVRDPVQRSTNLLYLSTCSDLLGLISVIAGYYSQENTSLLYNNRLTIIHDRSSSLKLNIQLKILHAAIDVGPIVQSTRIAATPVADSVPATPVIDAARGTPVAKPQADATPYDTPPNHNERSVDAP